MVHPSPLDIAARPRRPSVLSLQDLSPTAVQLRRRSVVQLQMPKSLAGLSPVAASPHPRRHPRHRRDPSKVAVPKKRSERQIERLKILFDINHPQLSAPVEPQSATHAGEMKRGRRGRRSSIANLGTTGVSPADREKSSLDLESTLHLVQEGEMLRQMKRAYDPRGHGEGQDLYSQKNLLKRESLKFDPALLELLGELWNLVDSNTNGVLEWEEYHVLHNKLVAALIGRKSDAELEQLARDDWEQDTMGGHDTINRNRFYNSMFRLADQWTNEISLDAYVKFLKDTFNRVTTRREDGALVLKSTDMIKCARSPKRKAAKGLRKGGSPSRSGSRSPPKALRRRKTGSPQVLRRAVAGRDAAKAEQQSSTHKKTKNTDEILSSVFVDEHLPNAKSPNDVRARTRKLSSNDRDPNRFTEISSVKTVQTSIEPPSVTEEPQMLEASISVGGGCKHEVGRSVYGVTDPKQRSIDLSTNEAENVKWPVRTADSDVGDDVRERLMPAANYGTDGCIQCPDKEVGNDSQGTPSTCGPTERFTEPFSASPGKGPPTKPHSSMVHSSTRRHYPVQPSGPHSYGTGLLDHRSQTVGSWSGACTDSAPTVQGMEPENTIPVTRDLPMRVASAPFPPGTKWWNKLHFDPSWWARQEVHVSARQLPVFLRAGGATFNAVRHALSTKRLEIVFERIVSFLPEWPQAGKGESGLRTLGSAVSRGVQWPSCGFCVAKTDVFSTHVPSFMVPVLNGTIAYGLAPHRQIAGDGKVASRDPSTSRTSADPHVRSVASIVEQQKHLEEISTKCSAERPRPRTVEGGRRGDAGLSHDFSRITLIRPRTACSERRVARRVGLDGSRWGVANVYQPESLAVSSGAFPRTAPFTQRPRTAHAGLSRAITRADKKERGVGVASPESHHVSRPRRDCRDRRNHFSVVQPRSLLKTVPGRYAGFGERRAKLECANSLEVAAQQMDFLPRYR